MKKPQRITFALPLLLAASSLAETPASQPAKSPLETAWTDLAAGEPQASRAILFFAADPAQAVTFFRTKLTPLKLDPAAARALSANLASDDAQVWRPAFDKLQYLDPRLAIELTTLMTEVQDAPARQRLCALLTERDPATLDGMTIELVTLAGGRYNFAAQRDDGRRISWPVESQIGRLTDAGRVAKKSWAAADRALAVLSALGTADALAIVKDMTAGHPDAQPTKVATQLLAAAATAPADNPAQQMEAWWNELQLDGSPATIALLKLAAHPNETTAFLKTRMVPLKMEQADMQPLLEALASDKEDDWKPAFEKLRYFDPRLCFDLETLMKSATDDAQRTRLVEVLLDVPPGTFKGKVFQLQRAGEANFTLTDERRAAYPIAWLVSQIDRYAGATARPQWRRAARAIVLLAHIATPAARTLVESMATGHPEAEPTVAAKEELAQWK